MKKLIIKSIKFFLWFLGLFCLFVFNIWLINQGSGFTVPRELLFRTYAEIWKPIIAFPIILIILLLADKFIFPLLAKINNRKKIILIFILCLISGASLFHTVQTNPDYGRYQVESKYLVNHGIVKFFQNYEKFHSGIDLPIMPLIYGLALKIIGEGQLAVLTVNFFVFLGILLLIYSIAKTLFDKKVAVLSIILFATTPFIVTQTPLFLVDLGQTFFLTLSVFLLINLIKKPSFKKSLFIGLVLFIASLAKITSILFLITFLITSFLWVILKKNNQTSLYSLITTWGTMIILDSAYVFWKKGIFYSLILRYFPPKIIVSSLKPLLLLGLALAILVIFAKSFLKKIKNSQKTFNRFCFVLTIITYSLLAWLFFFKTNRTSFYLKTPFVALNIPFAVLFYASVHFIFKKRSLSAFILLPWAFAVILIPNTMFKYQLPSYPAIIILAAFVLVSLFKESRKQMKYLLVVLSFSFAITYFFFLPMINNHIKNNIRQAARFADQYQPKKITILFFPIGEYGVELSKYIDETNKWGTPSLAHLIDLYTVGEVVYETEKEFLENLSDGQIPDILMLAAHLDRPFAIPSPLKEKINAHFSEGPMFDQARGAGIWRVKLKTFYRLKPE